jgi:hypothetical protein
MIWRKSKKCEKVINRLVQEYHSRHSQKARQEIAKVDIDYISRGLPNSSAVVTGKLVIEYDYIDRLVDFLFQSLEKDYPHFPRKVCKEFLINVVEVEYKKLLPLVNTWLMQACFAQLPEQYRKDILGRLEQTKNNIENRCELYSEKKFLWIGLKKEYKFSITIVIAIISITVNVLQYSSSLREPALEMYFTESQYKATEIGITGPLGKHIHEVTLSFTIANPTKKTAENTWLTLLASGRVKIISDDSRTKYRNRELVNRVDIPLDSVHSTKVGKPANVEIVLKWMSIDMTDISSVSPPFVINKITNYIAEFPIYAEISANDMKPAEVYLKISIGTREAFKEAKYEGEIFEVGDNGELIKTLL